MCRCLGAGCRGCASRNSSAPTGSRPVEAAIAPVAPTTSVETQPSGAEVCLTIGNTQAFNARLNETDLSSFEQHMVCSYMTGALLPHVSAEDAALITEKAIAFVKAMTK